MNNNLQMNKIDSSKCSHKTLLYKNGISLGKIKRGLTQVTIEQDVRALANGHFKNTTIF